MTDFYMNATLGWNWVNTIFFENQNRLKYLPLLTEYKPMLGY